MDNLKLNIDINVFNSRYWLFCAEVFWTRARCRSDCVIFHFFFFVVVVHFRSSCYAAVSGE